MIEILFRLICAPWNFHNISQSLFFLIINFKRKLHYQLFNLPILYILSFNLFFVISFNSIFHGFKSFFNRISEINLMKTHVMKFLFKTRHFKLNCFLDSMHKTLPFIRFINRVISLNSQTFNLGRISKGKEVKSTFFIHFCPLTIFVYQFSRHHFFK